MRKLLITLFIVTISIWSFAWYQTARADIYGSSLINYWPADDNTGTTVKDYGSAPQNMTLNGTATFSRGRIGSSAMSFTGVTGNGASFTGVTSGTTFTIAMWMYSKACTAYCNGFTQAGVQGLYYYGPTHKLDFYYSGDHFSTTAFVDNVWTHVVVTVISGNLIYYINGKADASVYGSVPSSSFNGSGCDSGTGGECMNGMYDDERLYNRALTGAEVQQLYLQGASSHINSF